MENCVSRQTRIEIVDYLKAVCVFFVIILHADTNFGLKIRNTILYIFGFKMAVPIFMLLSGYTIAMSQDKKSSVKDMYSYDVLLKKTVRFTNAIIVCILMYITILSISGNLSYNSFIDIFLFGKFGQGSYYYYLMMEFIFIGPLIVYIVKHIMEKGVLLLIIINLLFEIVIHIFNIDVQIYRLLIFRYLTEIAFGCYIYINNKKISKRKLLFSLAIGGCYLLIYSYFKVEPKLFTYWTDTSMMVAFWIFPFLYFILFYGKNWKINGIIGDTVSLCGKSSYHIFCTQMIWFTIAPFFYKIISFQISAWCKTGISASICFIFGIFFYMLDDIVQKFIYAKMKLI